MNGLLFLFLVAPVLIIFPISFSGNSYISWPPTSFSLRWFAGIFQDATIAQGFGNSLTLAAIVTAVDIVAAVPAALAIGRGKFIGRSFLLMFLTAPLLVPSVVLGLGLLIVLSGHGLEGSLFGLIIAHLAITLPYIVQTLVAAISTLPLFIEEAAGSLGASPWNVLIRVTLPLLRPALIAGAAMVFIISFDEAVVTLFVVGPDTMTLPIVLFRYAQTRFDPLVAAVSVLLVAVTLCIVLILDKSVGLQRALGRR